MAGVPRYGSTCNAVRFGRRVNCARGTHIALCASATVIIVERRVRATMTRGKEAGGHGRTRRSPTARYSANPSCPRARCFFPRDELCANAMQPVRETLAFFSAISIFRFLRVRFRHVAPGISSLRAGRFTKIDKYPSSATGRENDVWTLRY